MDNRVPVILRGGTRDGEEWPVPADSVDGWRLVFDSEGRGKEYGEVYVVTEATVALLDGRTARVAAIQPT